MNRFASILILTALYGCDRDVQYLHCTGTVEVATNNLAADVTEVETTLMVKQSDKSIMQLGHDGKFAPICSECTREVSSEAVRWSRREPQSKEKPSESYSFSIDRKSGRLEGARTFTVPKPIVMTTTTRQDMQCDRSSAPPSNT